MNDTFHHLWKREASIQITIRPCDLLSNLFICRKAFRRPKFLHLSKEHTLGLIRPRLNGGWFWQIFYTHFYTEGKNGDKSKEYCLRGFFSLVWGGSSGISKWSNHLRFFIATISNRIKVIHKISCKTYLSDMFQWNEHWDLLNGGWTCSWQPCH